MEKKGESDIRWGEREGNRNDMFKEGGWISGGGLPGTDHC